MGEDYQAVGIWEVGSGWLGLGPRASGIRVSCFSI